MIGNTLSTAMTSDPCLRTGTSTTVLNAPSRPVSRRSWYPKLHWSGEGSRGEERGEKGTGGGGGGGGGRRRFYIKLHIQVELFPCLLYTVPCGSNDEQLVSGTTNL